MKNDTIKVSPIKREAVEIEIHKNVKLPNSNIILEKGDKICILKEDSSDIRYYEDQMVRAFSLEPYSMKMQVTSDSGESKWLTITRETVIAFNNVFGNLDTSDWPM